MSDAIYVKYVIFGIYDIIDIYGIGHMSWMNMLDIKFGGLKQIFQMKIRTYEF